MNMTIDEFINGEFRVICQSENEYAEFLKALQKRGIIWANGDLPMKGLDLFEMYRNYGIGLNCGKDRRLTRQQLTARKIYYSELSKDVSELYSLKIKQKNRKVSAILCDETGKYIKHATAKCHPQDEFDFETGKKIAFQRLFDIESVKDEPNTRHGLILKSQFKLFKNNNFGVVGKKTNVEAFGHSKLFIGDVVELFRGAASHGLHCICEDSDHPTGFVMGYANIKFKNGQGKSTNGNDLLIIKRKSYRDMKSGDIVDFIRYEEI